MRNNKIDWDFIAYLGFIIAVLIITLMARILLSQH